MTVVVKTLVQSKYIEATQSTQYTAQNVKAVIDKSTVTNVGIVNATLSVNLAASSDPLSNSNKIIDSKTIAPGECIDLTEITGHVLDAGGFISTITNQSNVLVLRISGREIS